MRRTFTNRLIGFSALFLSVVLGGCDVGDKDVSSEPPYNGLIGHCYRFKVELFLYKNEYSEHAYIGRYDDNLKFGDRTLPKVVDKKYIGQNYRGSSILGIVPAGATFTVKSVIRGVSSPDVVVKLVGEVFYEKNRIKDVSAIFVQSEVDGRDNRLPEIDKNIAGEIAPESTGGNQ
jgi:hypothetical protein